MFLGEIKIENGVVFAVPSLASKDLLHAGPLWINVNLEYCRHGTFGEILLGKEIDDSSTESSATKGANYSTQISERVKLVNEVWIG